MSKYTVWYDSIIDQARTEPFAGYTETHHIIPRSLGGTNDPVNLVNLSARQHFVCHWLLTKIHAGQERGKMINALVMMQGENANQHRYKTKITSRAFAKLREDYAAYISKMNTGSKLTPEQCEKVSASKRGKRRPKFSDEWKAKLSAARTGEKNHRFGVSISDATRAKQRAKALGRKQSAETISKKADAIRGMKREKKLCPHCDKEVAVNGYTRWHGDNCKLKAA